MSAPDSSAAQPVIPDYELIRLIGQGSYGDVWLARGVTGLFRAIKIVWRSRFADAAPFEREFKGMKEFAAISLGESIQLALLHIGRNDEAGFFYYVMELADDAERGRNIDPAHYVPLTLTEVRQRRGRVPAADCVAYGVELSRVLAGLHRRGLVHRDIKPSNVILVGGVAKVADIGLVTATASARTFIGTEGFVPPEGPGTPAGDVFALGKLLYELSTGLDRQEFPQLPPGLKRLPDHRVLLELNEVILRACEPAPDQRYRNAAEILADLLVLQGGSSLRRQRAAIWARRGGIAVALVIVAVASLSLWWKSSSAPARPAPPAVPALPEAPMSEARRLAYQARTLLLKPAGGTDKYETVTLLCDRALTLDPTDAEVWAIASQADTSMASYGYDSSEKRIASAQSNAAKAINLNPGSFEARLARAMFQAMLGGQPVAAEAESALRALQAEYPREIRTLEALGSLLRKQGRGEEAIAVDEEEAQLPGGAVIGLAQKAWALRGLWRFDEAEAALDQSIALEPLAASVSLRVFQDLSWHGDPDRALAALRKLPADELTMDVGVAAAVRVYKWRREPAELLKFLAAVPRDWLTWSIVGPKAALTGDANAELNNPAAARDDWQAALTLVGQRLAATPNDRNLLEWKAYLEALLGDPARAQATWQRSREAPGYLPFLLNVEKIQRIVTPDQVIDELEQRAKDASDHLVQRRRSLSAFISAADLRLNPAWDGLRSLPRFQALQARLDADPLFSPTAKVATTSAMTPDEHLAEAAPAPAPASGKRIAVLPFEDLNDDKNDDFFADGIHEEIITNLANIASLHVISRTSVTPYRNTTKKVGQIARELGVEFILEGSVRRVGQKVRVTGQLIRAAADEHMWAKAYDGDLSDILGIQTQIATTIAEQLKAVLTPEENLRLTAITVADPVAYELYLQAWGLRRKSDDVTELDAQAEPLLVRATELDPKFALPWVELASIHVLRFFNARSFESERELAKQAIDRALALAPDRAEVQAGLGAYYYFAFRDYDSAAKHYQRALELEPSNAEVHRLLGLLARRRARWPEAVAELRRAHELDPLNHVISSLLEHTMLCTRDYPAVRALALALAQSEPDNPDYTLDLSLDVAFFDANLARSRRPLDEWLAALTPEQRRTPFFRKQEPWIAFIVGDVARFESLVGPELSGNSGPLDGETRARFAIAERVLGHDARDFLAKDRVRLEDLTRINPEEPNGWVELACCCALQEDPERADFALGRVIELCPEDKDAINWYSLAVQRAQVLAWLGRKDAAIALLARLAQKPGPGMDPFTLQANPCWWPLRDDPRFQAIPDIVMGKPSVPAGAPAVSSSPTPLK